MDFKCRFTNIAVAQVAKHRSCKPGVVSSILQEADCERSLSSKIYRYIIGYLVSLVGPGQRNGFAAPIDIYISCNPIYTRHFFERKQSMSSI
ncbi:unnamed protein product [Acanthoscelides obtectus]|uniref:Uncharacterized protein n=1 Tax=Acanthoscelides obtectus TaxID=200917 RepID=A0A9P0LS77_ACAOB|nr:unnamed protein product [Acanthoscelides obtectus]CAK1679907.1 hypothetical protein AOBTE_LOCUS32453 [Acanthoscelides obtectus]